MAYTVKHNKTHVHQVQTIYFTARESNIISVIYETDVEEEFKKNIPVLTRLLAFFLPIAITNYVSICLAMVSHRVPHTCTCSLFPKKMYFHKIS